MQFMDEYPVLRQKFPPGDFRVLRKKEEDVDSDLFSGPEYILWKALAFSNEPARVFRKACMTVFEGIKLLSEFHDRGLIWIESAVESDEDTVAPVYEKKRSLKWQSVIKAALLAGVLAAVLLWAAKLFLSSEESQFFRSWMGFF